MKKYLLLAGITWWVLGCATPPPSPGARTSDTDDSIQAAKSPRLKSETDTQHATPAASEDAAPAQRPSPNEELAVLVTHSGALITQVNGDSNLRCMQPDCRIPLPPGTHRVAVKYRDTAIRAGSTVTYASMYPRVVEINLEPGHRYSVTASGRHSQKWWISIEDQTANKTVYDDRKESQ